MLNVLLLGDSITKGQYIDPSLTWASLIQLDVEFKKQGLHFYTSCVSGETSTKTLDRLITELESFPPDVLFIQVGLNDANHWKSEGGTHPRTSPGRFQANLEEMITRSRLSGVNRIILSTMHKVNKPIDCNGKPFEFFRGTYNDIIRNVALNSSIEIFDLDEICNQDFSPDFLMEAPDLLHLSEIGHKWFYTHLKEFFKEQNVNATSMGKRSRNIESNTDWR